MFILLKDVKDTTGMVIHQRKETEWNDEAQWATDHAAHKTPQAEVYRVTLTAILYYIWQEKNCRIFQHKKRSTEILRLVIQDIHNRTSVFPRLVGTMHRLNLYPLIYSTSLERK